MTSTGRPKLGDVFRGESLDNIERLAGLLPAGPTGKTTSVRPVPVPAMPEIDDSQPVPAERADQELVSAQPERGGGANDDHVQQRRVATAASGAPAVEAAEGPGRKVRKVAQEGAAPAVRPRREDSSSSARDTITKMVPANIDVTVHKELRRFAVRTELSFATIALRAIEANAAELSQLWRRPPAEPVRAGLFGSVPDRLGNRRTEPAVQVQLRLQASDAAVLDRLVAEWAAPSRSALVNEGLKRYVSTEITAT